MKPADRGQPEAAIHDPGRADPGEADQTADQRGVPVQSGRAAPQLLAQRCTTCVFRPGNPMGLRPGRLGELIAHNLAVGAALICHSTLPYGNHPDVGESVCRGWYDNYSDRTTAIQLLERLGHPWHLITLPPPALDRIEASP